MARKSGWNDPELRMLHRFAVLEPDSLLFRLATDKAISGNRITAYTRETCTAMAERTPNGAQTRGGMTRSLAGRRSTPFFLSEPVPMGVSGDPGGVVES
jgi:hypothetical protein